MEISTGDLPGLGAPPPATETEIDIGSRIKQFRKRAKLTLNQASERTGVAISTLSKIERGELSPTLGTLQRVAKGLSFDISSLFAPPLRPERAARQATTRAGEGRHYSTAVASHLCLSTELASKKMLPFRTTVLARSTSDYDGWIYHPGENFMFVLSGTVLFYSEFYEPVELNVGDSFYYDGSMGHFTVAKGEEKTEILWIYTA